MKRPAATFLIGLALVMSMGPLTTLKPLFAAATCGMSLAAESLRPEAA